VIFRKVLVDVANLPTIDKHILASSCLLAEQINLQLMLKV